MKRELSPREVRIVLLLPALIVAGIYVFAFDWPHQTHLNDLRTAAARERENPVSDAQLRYAGAEVTVLTQQIEMEKRRAASTTQPSLMLPARWTTPSSRLNAVAQIDSVFKAHALYILSTSRQPNTAISAVAPRALAEFAGAVVHEGHAPVPEILKIELVGSYGDVLNALGELNRSETFIIPLGLSMDSLGEQTGYRRWSLWVWV
jgi:hypothetical protein